MQGNLPGSDDSDADEVIFRVHMIFKARLLGAVRNSNLEYNKKWT